MNLYAYKFSVNKIKQILGLITIIGITRNYRHISPVIAYLYCSYNNVDGTNFIVDKI